jgi:hypothetical protein
MSKEYQFKLYERSLHSSRIVDGLVGVKSQSHRCEQYCKPCYKGNRIEPIVALRHLHDTEDYLIKTSMIRDWVWASTCRICNRKSRSEEKILNHIKLRHYKNCYSCDNCGDFFVSERAHANHEC